MQARVSDSRQGWLGLGAAVVPHVLLLAYMIVHAAWWGRLEVMLAPLGVILSFLLWFPRSSRALAGGVAAGTVLGVLIVGAGALALH
jgi:hypothetical protein